MKPEVIHGFMALHPAVQVTIILAVAAIAITILRRI